MNWFWFGFGFDPQWFLKFPSSLCDLQVILVGFLDLGMFSNIYNGSVLNTLIFIGFQLFTIDPFDCNDFLIFAYIYKRIPQISLIALDFLLI